MRCLPDVTREEVEILARAMTYKYAFFKIQLGGAKAGIRVDYSESAEKKAQLFREAARHFEALIRGNLWSPWSDMNFFRSDLRTFYSGIGIDFPSNGSGGSSFRTALSAFAALEAVVGHFGAGRAGVRLALEGFGSVASYLAPLLRDHALRLVGASTLSGAVYRRDGLDLDAIVRAYQKSGADWVEARGEWDRISRDDLFRLDCDVLIPCARVHSIDKERAAEISARCIVPIANSPCAPEAFEVLDSRGISYVPDYVVNGGGVCGPALFGATPDRLAAAGPFMAAFGSMVRRLLLLSDRRRVPVRAAADEVACGNA
jgi:glutamate dehydrogenase/leucine dehydrogenase